MDTNLTTRRDLMAARDKAVAAKDWPEFQRLTTALSKLPMKGVPELTAKDIARYAAKHR